MKQARSLLLSLVQLTGIKKGQVLPATVTARNDRRRTERLMGMLLVMMSVQMVLDGIHADPQQSLLNM